MRLAMWSGPRNLSTAMMYSFAQRRDFAVVDEPFYGPYLRLTGLDHPMRQEVLASRPETEFEVEQSLIGPIPDDKPNVYHKHMCQHMLPGMPRTFIAQCTNVFLIRHPQRVVASFAKGYPKLTVDDVGFHQQSRLFDEVGALGQTPVVIDSEDIRTDPKHALRALCDAISLEWDASMLSWSKGGHPSDGVWAAHWYKSVHQSTGFAGPEGPMPDVGDHQTLVKACMPHFKKMSACKLRL
ncbi:HAD family hydrolase [Marivita sp. S0852]|uniref:sulfotransferase-like domain-containing protein n=1 Tax=Marivita sp. S0852 TaxID=3373893 RepID=UPI003981E04D